MLMSKVNLENSKKRKNDEFYTRYEDVEKELDKFDFSDKDVYCPCDTEQSAFVQYFKKHPCKSLTFTSDDYHNHKARGVIVTNPPFSLFRDFWKWCGECDMVLIANVNAVFYKECFEAFKTRKVKVLDEVKWFKTQEGLLRGVACIWITTFEVKKKPLELTAHYDEQLYPKYDNSSAINVNRLEDIPCDYYGAMGVPVTILVKWDPCQFEVLGCSHLGMFETTRLYNDFWEVRQGGSATGAKGSKINGHPVLKGRGNKSVYYTNGKEEVYCMYARIYIKRIV